MSDNQDPQPPEEKPEIQMPSWIEDAIVQSQARDQQPNEEKQGERVVASSSDSTSRPPENRPPGTANPNVTINDQESKSSAGNEPARKPATAPGKPAVRILRPETAAPARVGPPPPPGQPYISSRLAEKIDGGGPGSEKSGGNPMIAIGGIVLLLGLGAFIAFSTGVFGGKKPEAPKPAAEPVAETPPPAAEPTATTPAPTEGTTPAATTPGGTTTASQNTTPPATPAATATKPATPPATKPAATKPADAGAGAGAAAAATPAAPAVKKTYGVAIGSYMDEARAKEVSDQIAAAASLPATVVEAKEDGTTMYKVVVGKFDSKSAAENAGTDLIVKGLAKEARVTAVK